MIELLKEAIAIIEEGTLPVILPLILCSIGIWVLIIERGFFLFDTTLYAFWPPLRRKRQEIKDAVGNCLNEYLEDPTEAKRRELIDLCRRHKSAYHRFLIRALTERTGSSAATTDLMLAEASLNQELEIEKGLGLLSTLSKVAPLLGLLGTVTGMIQTFQAMMFASTSDPRALSSGVSIALIATEVGLVVGLPGVIGMSWLSRRAQVLEEEIRLVSMRLRQVLVPTAKEA